MESNILISNWKEIYYEYLVHNGVSEGHLEKWHDRTESMIEYWHKLESGELKQIYNSFNHFFIVQIDYYKKMNENYRRDIKKPVPLKVEKGTGGRWWY